MSDFAKMEVSITLTIEEWFAFISKAAGVGLSDDGRRIARETGLKLAKQMKKVCDDYKSK